MSGSIPVSSSIEAGGAEAPRTASHKTESPGARAWRRFRRNRLGFNSLVIFLVLFGISLVAEVWSNDKPLIVGHDLPRGHLRRRLPKPG
jgi:microcin C transport system permease protein